MFVKSYLATYPQVALTRRPSFGNVPQVASLRSESLHCHSHVSRGTFVLLQFALSKKKKTELGKAIVTLETMKTRMTKRHFPERDSPVDTEPRYPFYWCHMKNVFKTFSHVVPMLRDWLVVPKVWLLALGCFYLFALWFCCPSFYPESSVSFLSDKSCLEEERALVPSIQSHAWRHLIWEQCWLSSATVPDVSVQCTQMNKTEVICIFTCCPKGKLNEPKCMFPWYGRERAHRVRIKLLVRAWEGSWVVPGETKVSESRRHAGAPRLEILFFCSPPRRVCVTHAWSDNAVFLYHGL